MPQLPWDPNKSLSESLNPWVTLVSTPGSQGESCQPYFHLQVPDYVCALVITPDGKVPLVRQYRLPARNSTLELPGGLVDKGHTPMLAILQELREEIGGSHRGRLVTLPPLMVDTGRIENRMHAFIFFDFHPNTDHISEPGLSQIWFSTSEFKQLALNSKIIHAGHLATILLASCLGYI